MSGRYCLMGLAVANSGGDMGHAANFAHDHYVDTWTLLNAETVAYQKTLFSCGSPPYEYLTIPAVDLRYSLFKFHYSEI